MPNALARRLLGGGATLLVIALLVAAPAHAAIDCNLSPDAPICNRGDDPGGDPGGGSDPAKANVLTVSQRDEVAPGEFLSTTATIDRGALMMYASTHIWTTNWWWGFHGCVEFEFLSAYGTVLTHSQKVCQGVDGTAIGISDRSTSVTWHLYPYSTSQMASVRIIHTKL